LYLRGANITGLAALALIFVAMAISGANNAALAGYFSAALLLLFAAKILIAPAHAARGVLADNWISLACVLAFVGIAGLTATPSSWLGAAALDGGLNERAGSLAPFRTIEGIAAFGAPVAAFGLGALATHEPAARGFIARASAALAICFCLWALVLHGLLGRPRLDAGLGSANTAACVFGVIGVSSASLLLRDMRKRGENSAFGALRSPIALAALLLSLLCLALTLSRGGLAASVVGFAVLVGITARHGALAQIVRGAAALLVIAVPLAGYVLFRRGALSLAAPGGEGDSVSAESRQILVDVYWRAFLDRPWFGHGLNTYHDISSISADPANWEALRTSGSVHNVYVQTLAETGMLGMALLAMALAVPLTRSVFAAMRHDGELAAAVCGVWALALTQGAVDFGLQTPAIAALLTFALGAYSRRSPL
jgi:O-antigen ligase